MRVIFFNGPPGCGKDTAAQFAVGYFGGIHLSIAAPIKRAVHELLSVPRHATEMLEREPAKKDAESEWFLGLTPRQCYIAMSETLARPLWGQDVFGRLMVQRLRQETGAPYAFFSDGGFRAETDAVVAEVGAGNVLLVRIRREGHSFVHDSRRYLDMDELGVPSLELANNGPLEQFRLAVVSAVSGWLRGPPR